MEFLRKGRILSQEDWLSGNIMGDVTASFLPLSFEVFFALTAGEMTRSLFIYSGTISVYC